MGDFYRQFLSSMTGAADSHPVTSPDEMNPNLIPAVTMPMSTPSPMHGPYQNLGYFPGFQEPVFLNAAKSQKSRRKSGAGLGAGLDPVKHRRTRSGCFMCRSRRVKCDETRPICERCRKGNRECVYPDPPSSKGNSGHSSKSNDASSAARHTSPMSSNEGEEEDAEQESKLDTIPDEEEPDDISRRGSASAASQTRRTSTTSTTALSAGRQMSETPSQDGTKSSPSASTVGTRSWTPAAYQTPELLVSPTGRSDWSILPLDFQRYLGFFVENITHYHYSLAIDGDDFFNTILPKVAVQFEPLLNAVVGFSAYHVTLKDPNGKLQDFLQYYNKSVTQLLGILKRKETHHLFVLITILQLATIEEYLGDWVNLMGHQKAAFEIITQIFTPQTVMQTPIGRMCLNWYARFDNTVALMGRFPTELPREWFAAPVEFHQAQMVSNPDVLRWKIEDRSARLRLISYDMSILYARGSRGQITRTDYNYEHDLLSKQLDEWKNTWDPVLSDQRYLITDFAWRRPPDPDDIVNPYVPGILYDHPLFNSTIITVEWHSITMMHKSQSNIPPEQLFEELSGHAYVVCQHFETMEYWPSIPAGALLTLQPCLSIAALFVPHYPKQNVWLRRKFALLEMMGHIHPSSRRKKMAEVFRDSSCAQWWLPNNEGFTPVLQSIRSFADERNARAVTAQQENLREMKHLFAKLELSDHEMDPKGKGIDVRT